ncbi:MAG: hypothetical protein RLZZ398_343 [Verrucomicrobiota bacterium]
MSSHAPLMENPIRKSRRRRSSARTETFQWDTEEGALIPHGAESLSSNRIVFFLIVFMGLVIVMIVVVRLRDEHLPVEAREIPVKVNLSPVSEPPAKAEVKSETVISELLGFVNDPTHAARSRRMFRQAEALEHLENYYDQRGRTLPRKIINPSVSAVNFKDRELLLVAFLDESNRAWSAPFEWDGDSYRLHWEAMTGFGDISWSEFLEKRPKGTFTMRGNFFLPENENFDALATDHLVVLLNHPDLPHPASVLVPKESKIHRQLASYPRATDIPGIVEIKWPEGNSERPVLTGWIQRDWID